MQRRAGLTGRCPSPSAALIGAIVTGRVLSALPRLALTSLISSGRYHTSADVNIGTDRAGRYTCARAVRRRPLRSGCRHGLPRGGDTFAAVVHRRDVRPQVLIRCTACPARFKAWPMRCSRRTRRTACGRRSPARWTAGWRWTSAFSPRTPRYRSSRSSAACAGRHMIRRNALPSPRRRLRVGAGVGGAVAVVVGVPVSRRLGREARSHRAPSVAFVGGHAEPLPRLVGRDLTVADVEFIFWARGRLNRRSARSCESSGPRARAGPRALGGQRDALPGGRHRGQDGHDDDKDDQRERPTSGHDSPTTDLDALRPGQARRPKTRRGVHASPCEPFSNSLRL